MKKSTLFLLVFVVTITTSAQNNLKVPSFEEVLSLPEINNPQISPNGQNVLYEVRTTDWVANRFDTEIWVFKRGERAKQLTYNEKSSSHSPQWSPDRQWIAFLSNRGNGNQIQVIRLNEGEMFPTTNIDGDVNSFEWSPDGKQFGFTMDQKGSKEEKMMNERYGDFEIGDTTYKHSWIYTVEFQISHINVVKLPYYGKNKDNCIEHSVSACNEDPTKVNIRISNISAYDFCNVVLSPSGETTNYGIVEEDQSTCYRAFESAYNYALIESESISIVSLKIYSKSFFCNVNEI